ncbi:unnamed protein product [Pseudo-nitzschia multistriata]|uniref:Uncharacterized protein n=1 Tax=Pseudo-nitzschia multistriata TaxID=183589 RepID=A0A448YUV7_9STRA|nr:unnamed protein product [Pseudo-nitzschia multistriata]
MSNVTVIGLGAMGGGMARSLLRSDAVASVSGFDLNPELVSGFHGEAKQAGKAVGDEPPESLTLDKFVDAETTDVALIVLVNEAQCQSVCFDGENGRNLRSLMRPGSTVIVSSTVTPAWSKRASSGFAEAGIRFLDCPISGGPVRALAGEITMMCSGDPEDLNDADPLFRAMGTEIHVVKGGVGMGSTVKMVHQLLAGVHIAVAAEALALAAKAGLDVRQLYDIVRGAAGNSWMFGDRGKRMIEYTGKDDEKVMSSLAIFIKDMDIVYSSAKALKCPVPIATAALQQYIGGSGLGLDRKDDSQVVRAYEALSGVSVSASASAFASASASKSETPAAPPPPDGEASGTGAETEAGTSWTLPDGTEEAIVDCCEEPHHRPILSNGFVRVLEARIPPGDTTVAHRHSRPSLYIFLSEHGADLENHVLGSPGPVADRVGFGEVRYGAHSETDPLVHKLANQGSSPSEMVCLDAEVLSAAPVVRSEPLAEARHELVASHPGCRVYRLVLRPGESAEVGYPFFSLGVVMKGSTARTAIGGVSWEEARRTGRAEWKAPSAGERLSNTGDTVYEQYVVEWC